MWMGPPYSFIRLTAVISSRGSETNAESSENPLLLCRVAEKSCQ